MLAFPVVVDKMKPSSRLAGAARRRIMRPLPLLSQFRSLVRDTPPCSLSTSSSSNTSGGGRKGVGKLNARTTTESETERVSLGSGGGGNAFSTAALEGVTSVVIEASKGAGSRKIEAPSADKSFVYMDDSWTAACSAVCGKCIAVLFRWSLAGRLRVLAVCASCGHVQLSNSGRL